ncbi:MAG: asparagine synthase (glutamine-hydrolyzing) [Gemmatimonadales bacterium]
MCGLVGILRFDQARVEPALLERMARTLAHRGPDGEGTFVDGSIGFGHKRLAIIDPAGGQQPMTFDGLTVVFNGAIYNYLELRDELAGLGQPFRTSSDTEVLLRAYAAWGEDCVDRLNGMFAFVLYDARRRRVLAARDHFGIKPLYYHQTAKRLLYASEIKALLAHPDLRGAVDPSGLADYLTFQLVLGDRTLFDGVRKLEPGHRQLVDLASGRVETRRYWEPTFVVDYQHTEEYFIAELDRLLGDSIRLQLRSDVPVGAYLSGGLDSGVVSHLAAAALDAPLQAFTGAFDEGRAFDEREYARTMSRHVGAELHEVVPTEREFIDLLPRLVYHMDEPAAGPGLFPQFMVARRAAESVKVCLGGQGGDEIFGGYARYLVAYLEQALKGAIFETNEEAEHIVSLGSIVPHLASLKQYVPMLRQFWSEGLFDPMDRRYFRLVDRSGGTGTMLTDDCRASVDREAAFGRFQSVFNHPDTQSYYSKMTHFDMLTLLPALLQVEDRASMAASLESRVPLLDRRIVDLVTSMPPRMKFKGGELKYILRKVMRGRLPDAILDRKDKMGFPVPLHLWAAGECRSFFADILLSRTCRERGLFDRKAVERALDSEEAYGRRLWGLVNLELWHRHFIDGEALPPPPPSMAAVTTRSRRRRTRV